MQKKSKFIKQGIYYRGEVNPLKIGTKTVGLDSRFHYSGPLALFSEKHHCIKFSFYLYFLSHVHKVGVFDFVAQHLP